MSVTQYVTTKRMVNVHLKSDKFFTCEHCSKITIKDGIFTRRLTFLKFLYIDRENNLSIFQCPKCLKNYSFSELRACLKI